MFDEGSALFTLFYGIFFYWSVYPPEKAAAAGISCDHIMLAGLVDETMNFVLYHIYRSIFKLVYYPVFVMVYLQWFTWKFGEEYVPLCIDELTLIVFFAAMLVSGYWYLRRWRTHPIAKQLQKFTDTERLKDWQAVAADINDEYRRANTTIITLNSVSRIILTDSWIIKVSPIWINVVRQSDATMVVFKNEVFDAGQETVEYINIAVKPTMPAIGEFSIRMQSVHFKTLQKCVSHPIQILPDVKFQRSLLEQFVDVFKDQVACNPPLQLPSETNLDKCLACMVTVSNVKIVKNCSNVDDAGNDLPPGMCCSVCNCRPLWCVECMARWFASRQDQQNRDSWLGAKCSCPLCRAKFCVLDVCRIERI